MLTLTWASPVFAGLKDCFDTARFIFKRPRLTLLKDVEFQIKRERDASFLFYSSEPPPWPKEENFSEWQNRALPTVQPYLLAQKGALDLGPMSQSYRQYLNFKRLPFFPDRQLPAGLINQYKMTFSHRGVRAKLSLFIPIGPKGHPVPGRLDKITHTLKELPTIALQKTHAITLSPYPPLITSPLGETEAETMEIFVFNKKKLIFINLFPFGLAQSDSRLIHIFRHEFGHAVAHAIYGKEGTPDSRWANAARDDGRPVSNYGEESLDEDFAEAVVAYLDNKTWAAPIVRAKFFHRFQILDEIFTESLKP